MKKNEHTLKVAAIKDNVSTQTTEEKGHQRYYSGHPMQPWEMNGARNTFLQTMDFSERKIKLIGRNGNLSEQNTRETMSRLKKGEEFKQRRPSASFA